MSSELAQARWCPRCGQPLSAEGAFPCLTCGYANVPPAATPANPYAPGPGTALPQGPLPAWYAWAITPRRHNLKVQVAVGVVGAIVALGICAALGGFAMPAQTTNSLASLPSHGTCSAEDDNGTPIPRVIRVGDPVPDFPVDTGDGTTQMLSVYRAGKPVWLNFWDSSCSHCVQQLQDIEQIHAFYQAHGVVLIGINTGQNPVQAARFAATRHYDWPQVFDSDSSVAAWYCIGGVPTDVFVDRAGNIRTILEGNGGQAQLRRALDDLIGR